MSKSDQAEKSSVMFEDRASVLVAKFCLKYQSQVDQSEPICRQKQNAHLNHLDHPKPIRLVQARGAQLVRRRLV